MSDSGNYRKLGRNGSGHHGLRSFSNFLLLLSAVFVFSLLYLYFSTSSELQSFRTDYEDLNTKHLNLKNELLDANLKLEQSKKDAEESIGKEETCQRELTDKSNKLNELQAHKSDCDGTVSGLNDKLELAKKRLEEKNSINQKNEATMVEQKKTIEQLQKELELARQAAAATTLPNVAAAQSGNVGNVVTAPNQAVAPLETPKASTPKMDGQQKDSAHEQVDPMDKDNTKDKEDAAHEKQSAADFIAPKRSPGGRVQLEEEAAQRDKLSNHKELLKAAANMDKQQEEKTMDEGGEDAAMDGNGKKKEAEMEPAKAAGVPTTGATEKNRPLVDALHGIVA